MAKKLLDRFVQSHGYSADMIEAILKTASPARYDFLIKRGVHGGLFWALWDGKSWVTLAGKDGARWFPLWPDRLFAERAFTEQIHKFAPGAVADTIALADWLEKYLPRIEARGDKVWAFPAVDLSGGIIPPLEMERDLRAEIARQAKGTRQDA